tara:strand:+ start:3987 stop:4580 length:594 start_codon:yes stop_codon:yes gene_type:complete
MKKITFCAGVGVVVLGLVGCSSPSMQAQKHELQMKTADQQIDEAPDWFMDSPKNTDEVIYGLGTAFSRDMQNAVRKAALQANYELAQTYKQSVSGSERTFVRESGVGEGGSVQSESDTVISKLVADADVSGAETVKKAVMREGSGFRAYVLAQYKLGTANLIKQEQVLEDQATSVRGSAKDAYEELNQRVERATLAQ